MIPEVLEVLRERNFRLLWLGQAFSQLGDRLIVVALALYVDEIGSPMDVGIVLAAHTVPLVTLLLIGGVWADRLPRHRVMIVSDLARAALHGLLAVLIVTGAVTIWHIVVIEALFGVARAFFLPAYSGLVPQTVPEARLQEASAARGFVQNAAEFVGPAVGTALVLGVGAAAAFALDAATFVVSAILLAGVRPRARGEDAPRAPLAKELRTGWREVRRRTWVWVTIASASAALMVGFAPLLTLGPSVAQEVYGDRAVFGLVLSAFGAGTLVGALAGVRWRPRHPLRAATLWVLPWTVGLALFAFGLPRGALTALWLLAGFGISLFAVWWETALAERIPPHVLSRVSAFDWMGSLGLLPVGYLLAGPLGEALGAVEVLAGGAVLAMLVTLAALTVRDIWRLERGQKSGVPSTGVEASA